MTEIENRIPLPSGQRDQEIAALQLFSQQTYAFAAKQQGDLPLHLAQPL